LQLGVTQISLLAQMERREMRMHWTTTFVEICIGLEINGYLPAELILIHDACY
jgi:hypothetical protein